MTWLSGTKVPAHAVVNASNNITAPVVAREHGDASRRSTVAVDSQ